MDAAPKTTRVARRVRARLLAASVVRRAGLGLVVGSGVALALVLASKLGWIELGWVLPASVGCGVGLVGGVLFGLARPWSLRAAAGRADAVLGLRDRLGNGLAFAAQEAGPAGLLAVRDAERAADEVDVSLVAPVRFGSAWAVWPVVLAAAVSSGLWVPPMEHPARQASQRETVAQERAAGAVAQAAQAAREVVGEQPSERAGGEALARMEEIERELRQGLREPEEALAESARELDALADRMEREAEGESAADQLARQQLAERVEQREAESELARALSEGDLEAARRAAAELSERADQLSDAERQRLADEFERLADQLDRGAEQSAGDRSAPTDEDQLDRALREQGIDDPAELGPADDPQAVREALEDRGVPPESAERLAEDLARREQERRAEDRARDDLQELSDSAREAAEDLREPPASREPGREQTPRDSAQGEPADSAGAADQQDQPLQEQGDRAEDGNGESTEPEQGERQSGAGGRENQAREDQGAERRGAEDGQQEGGERQGETGERDAEQSGDGEPSGERERADEQPGQESGRDAGRNPGQQGSEQPGQRQDGTPREQQGAGPDGQDGQQGTAPGASEPRDGEPDARGVERLRRQLERMAERGDGAEQRRGDAERLREQAERMLEQASPEERRELERLAREMGEGPGGSEQPGPVGPRAAPDRAWDSEFFDARGEGENGETRDGPVVAEWFSGEDERPLSGGAQPARGQALQDAARGAERALERRAVPRERQDLVRRVFERFRRRAEESGDSDGEGGS